MPDLCRALPSTQGSCYGCVKQALAEMVIPSVSAVHLQHWSDYRHVERALAHHADLCRLSTLDSFDPVVESLIALQLTQSL